MVRRVRARQRRRPRHPRLAALPDPRGPAPRCPVDRGLIGRTGRGVARRATARDLAGARRRGSGAGAAWRGSCITVSSGHELQVAGEPLAVLRASGPAAAGSCGRPALNSVVVLDTVPELATITVAESSSTATTPAHSTSPVWTDFARCATFSMSSVDLSNCSRKSPVAQLAHGFDVGIDVVVAHVEEHVRHLGGGVDRGRGPLLLLGAGQRQRLEPGVADLLPGLRRGLGLGVAHHVSDVVPEPVRARRPRPRCATQQPDRGHTDQRDGVEGDVEPDAGAVPGGRAGGHRRATGPTSSHFHASPPRTDRLPGWLNSTGFRWHRGCPAPGR